MGLRHGMGVLCRGMVNMVNMVTIEVGALLNLCTLHMPFHTYLPNIAQNKEKDFPYELDLLIILQKSICNHCSIDKSSSFLFFEFPFLKVQLCTV